MKRREFLLALAVCAGAATPVVSGLLRDHQETPPELAIEPPASPAHSPTPSKQPPSYEPTPDDPGPVCEPSDPIAPTQDPSSAPNEGSDPQPIPEPIPDGCPACGMARVQPRGKTFLSEYTK